jgi:transposase
MPDTSWASQEVDRFDHSHFSIDWQAKQVVCPAGQTSRDWGHIPDRHGKPSLRVRFPLPVCRACPLHERCTQTAAKVLILRPDEPTSTALENARPTGCATSYGDLSSRYAHKAAVAFTQRRVVSASSLRCSSAAATLCSKFPCATCSRTGRMASTV